jgi:arsenate reductase-like glutaredoxin family protein
MEPDTVRKNAGPMTTMICNKEGDTIQVLKTFESPPSEKQLKEAIKELGEGVYTILTCRTRTAKYTKVQTEKFDL